MAQTDKTGDPTKDICWSRGDTAPRAFTIGGGIDISSSTWRMVVNTDKDPNTGEPGTVLFDVAGTFVTDGTDGQVQFAPTPATWADGLLEYPARVFYEIEETKTGGAIDTLIKGIVIINEQIAT
jgi:hypothetical protein